MRKAPKQERSQFMVTAILEATARVFERRGMALTTRDVADEAGVSVGSLYQYFNNKEELLSALVAQLGSAVADIAMRDIASRLGQDARTFYRQLLIAVVQLLDANPGYRAIARHWHELRSVEAVHTAEQHLMDAARLYLLQHHEAYRPKDLPVSLFIAYNSTVYTLVRYFSLVHPPFGIERLVDELTSMMGAYMDEQRPARAEAQ
jgi:AcrR family transcriptional regulator